MTAKADDLCACGHIRYVHYPNRCIFSDCPCTGYQKADEPVLEVEG